MKGAEQYTFLQLVLLPGKNQFPALFSIQSAFLQNKDSPEVKVFDLKHTNLIYFQLQHRSCVASRHDVVLFFSMLPTGKKFYLHVEGNTVSIKNRFQPITAMVIYKFSTILENIVSQVLSSFCLQLHKMVCQNSVFLLVKNYLSDLFSPVLY